MVIGFTRLEGEGMDCILIFKFSNFQYSIMDVCVGAQYIVPLRLKIENLIIENFQYIDLANIRVKQRLIIFFRLFRFVD